MNENLKNKFIEFAVTHGTCTEVGDSKGANISYDLLMDTLIEMSHEYDSGRLMLSFLCNYDNDYVKIWAATYILPIDSELGVRTLKLLSNRKGFVGIDAAMTLKLWNSGNLKL